ncbi:Glycerol uptake facilitator protein (Glycerol diffusion facilitator) [Durusdinium trenchii]|uniref:Glycerol uptake facilitator protein (Glycerol diffusion facilitator) n=2 Tax=Durusdinium trenchii TaxID=1381693 RepID=A0ABP0RTL3_9DINO
MATPRARPSGEMPGAVTLNGKPLALDHLLGVSRLQEVLSVIVQQLNAQDERMKGFCKELSDMQALQERSLGQFSEDLQQVSAQLSTQEQRVAEIDERSRAAKDLAQEALRDGGLRQARRPRILGLGSPMRRLPEEAEEDDSGERPKELPYSSSSIVPLSPIKEVESPRRGSGASVSKSFDPDPVATLAAAVAAAKTASPRNESSPCHTPQLDVSVEAENDGKGPEHGKSSKVVLVNGIAYTQLNTIGRGGSSKVYLVQDPTGEILALKRVTLGSLEVAWGGQCVKVNEVCLPTADIEKFVNEYQALKNQLKPEEKPKSGKEELLRALLAEAIGTGMIVIFGCGSVCASLSGAYQGVWQVAAVWGLGVSLAIYATAGASGAHLNPAITLAFQLVRPKAHGMTWLKSAQYVLAQMLGAMLAGALNLLIYSGTIAAFEREQGIVRGEPRSILSASAFGEYFPNPGLSKEYGSGPHAQEDVSVVHALFTEAWGTFILAFVIFGITNSSNKVLGSMERVGVPFTIGMTVAVLLPLYAPITQAGWNPARDFGPRIIAALGGWGSVAIPGPRNGFWIYIVGPCLGAPFGAALAEKVLWTENSKQLEAFQNEVVLLRQLRDCDSVIQVVDAEVDRERGRINIVMEAGDMDLGRFLQSQPRLNMMQIQHLWKQMLEAVQVIHQERIVHSVRGSAFVIRIMARVAALCILAVALWRHRALCFLRNMAFVPAPARSASVDPAVAAGAVVVATAPMSAEAFVFKGKEYFDVFYGIEPLAWAFCGFVIVYYGAVVKNAAQKYNVPIAKIPPKVGTFVGKASTGARPVIGKGFRQIGGQTNGYGTR